jgi:charged multivesicular body protein 6
VNSIEFALVEQEFLKGLKQGNDVLNQLNKEMRIEDVEKLMDETADAIAYQKVIYG